MGAGVGTLVSVAEGRYVTRGCVEISTLGSDISIVDLGGSKRVARWISCLRVSVLMEGVNVEWDLERMAAVRSLAAAMMTSSRVADGILQW